MLRKVVCAAVILVLSVGVVFADEINAVITKVEGNKVTFAPLEGKGKNAKRGEEKTMPVAKDVKVVRYKFNKEEKKFEAGDEVEEGLKNKMFTNINEKGRRAMIITDDGNKRIKEIRVFGGRKNK